jgi:opacity protein-like surface antigen
MASQMRWIPVGLLTGLITVAVWSMPLPAKATHEHHHGSHMGWPFDEVHKGAFSLGGRATWFDPKDGTDSWYGGAQARLYIGEVFAIEGSADYRQNRFAGTRVDTYPVQVSALAYLLPGKRLSPFLLGGGGWYYTHVKSGAFDDTQNRFGLHAGGGLQYMLNEHWSIDTTYRYVWLEKVHSQEQNIINKSFQDSGQMVTFGLNFHF